MSGDIEDSGPALAQRVAELEAAVDRLTHPVVYATFPEMSEADLAQFRAEFEAAAGRPARLYVPPTIFDPEMVRVWLRECVTVVKPGETLVVQVPMDTQPSTVRQLQDYMDFEQQAGRPFAVLIVPGSGLAVAETQDAPERDLA